MKHLSKTLYNHSPLLITLFINNPKIYANKNFKFQNMWVKDDKFNSVVINKWNKLLHLNDSVKDMVRFSLKLKIHKLNLNLWSKNVFNNLFGTINEFKNKVVEVEELHRIDQSYSNEIKVAKSISLKIMI